MILFSPIGTADPITALGDGPMLHIVRHYRPIVVVLFLSAEIAAFENADRRYSAAITRLAPETDVRIVTYTNPSVHRFDLFVPVFRNHLVELSAEFPDRTILLNTSSGTPAMQAALVAINVFGIPRTTAVQVSTPARALSKPGDRESPDAYDLELMWDANDDNQPGAPNRCFEATSAALGALLERANLKQLIVSYDYSAAVTIAADSRLPDQVSNLIRGAMHRSRLEHLVAPKFFKDTAFTYDPANKVAEYISALALLAKREQWAEFARSATPAITIVLRAAVAKHLPEDRYLDDMGRVDRRKLEREPEIRCALKHPPKSPNAEWYLYTKDWLALLRQFAPDRVGALEVLGRFESRVRNTAAHEIVSISEDRITKDGGLLPEQLLKILARETGADLTLYDRLNDEIIRQIDMAPLGEQVRKMVQLYVSDSVSRISFADGRVIVWSEELGESQYPIETLDGITLFGRPTMTTPFIVEMLKRERDIQLFTTDGHYQGRISTPDVSYAPRLRQQVHRTDDPAFCLSLSKRIVSRKILNQQALIRAHTSGQDVAESIRTMKHSLAWVDRSGSLAELNGFEGNAAKAYFTALGHLVPQEFAFQGRSTRPPLDAFNSMVSLGYSLLYKNIIGAIERHILNAYIGFLHQDSRGHATLASDLMEVWRAPIIDDTVLRLIADGVVDTRAFSKNSDTGAVFATREATRSIARAFGNRIARTATYIKGDPHRYTFQYALDLQLQSLVRVIEAGHPARLVDIDITSEPSGA